MVLANLIPEEERVARTRRRHLRRWSVSVAVSFAALLMFAGIAWLARNEAATLRATSRQIDEDLERERTELRATSVEAQRVLVEIERAKALRSKRAWSGMVALIASNMPDGAWLTSLATDPVNPQSGARTAVAAPREKDDEDQPAVTIDAPRKLRVSGYAPDAADPHNFVASLGKAGVFTEVELTRFEREPVLDGFFFRFELICEW